MRHKICFATALMVSIFAFPAFAHDDDQPVNIIVQKKPEEAPKSLTVPNVEQAREIIEKTPGAVAIVSDETYRQGAATTVKDVLNTVPGVFAQPKYGQEDARLSIRGSGLSRSFHLRGIRLLVDGVPINDADGGGDFQEIDPLTARYAEVYKGGNALQYGAASLGGAVNFVSPTGYDAPAYLARIEGGSFGTSRVQLQTAGVSDKWDYVWSPTYSGSNGFRDHTKQDYLRLNGNIGYRFDADTETRFYLSANNLDQDIPSALTRDQALRNPRQTAASSFTQDTERDIDSIRLANKTNFALGDWDMSAGGFYSYKDLFHPLSFGVLDNIYRNGGGFVRGSLDDTLFERQNDLTLGVNIFHSLNDARVLQNNNGASDITFSHSEQSATNYELYGENHHYILPDIAAVTGLQFTHAIRDQDDQIGNDSAQKTYTSLMPKLGVLWDVTPDSQVFGNVTWTSEPPTFSELNPTAAPGFAALDPQKATTIEIGSRGHYQGIGWDAAIYHAWVSDELQLFTNSSGASQAINADKTIHQGIELGLDVPVAENLRFRPAYTFSHFTFDNDKTFGDNDIPGVPDHYIVAELRYDHPIGYYVAPNVEWVPTGYFVDNANTESLKTPAYALLGVKTGYQLENGLTLFAEGRNLLDKNYISNTNALPVANAGSALYNPGNGRAVYLGVQMTW